MKAAAAGPLVEIADWSEYALLDSGNGRKLERFGEKRLIRREPKAWWVPKLPVSDWRAADAENDDKGNWSGSGLSNRTWHMNYGQVRMEGRLTDMSKHVGIFPEQEPHWRWMKEGLESLKEPEVLNLFGYTGAASLVAASAGARVTHVDASKPAINWARHNQALSGMEAAPIRWVLEDAFKYVGRELKRGRQYDAVLLDPPSFGRGPKGEIWKVEADIVQLLQQLQRLLRNGHGMVILTMYNLEASSWMLSNLVRDCFGEGERSFGELVLQGPGETVLPLSLFCRWERLPHKLLRK